MLALSHTSQNNLSKTKFQLETRVSYAYVSNVRQPHYYLIGLDDKLWTKRGWMKTGRTEHLYLLDINQSIKTNDCPYSLVMKFGGDLELNPSSSLNFCL